MGDATKVCPNAARSLIFAGGLPGTTGVATQLLGYRTLRLAVTGLPIQGSRCGALRIVAVDHLSDEPNAEQAQYVQVQRAPERSW